MGFNSCQLRATTIRAVLPYLNPEVTFFMLGGVFRSDRTGFGESHWAVSARREFATEANEKEILIVQSLD